LGSELQATTTPVHVPLPEEQLNLLEASEQA
jgi:hypothetical protein